MTRKSGGWGTDVGLLLIRLMLGAVFIYHGADKLFGAFGGPGMEGFTEAVTKLGFPVPAVSAWAAAIAEFGGGILLVAGVAHELAVVALAVTMFVAAFAVHGSAFSARDGGMEYPLTLAVVLVAIGLTGPGRITLFGLMGEPDAEKSGGNEGSTASG